MLKNNNKLSILALSIATGLACLSYANNALADINNKGGVFFYGDNIQVGINKNATFGSDDFSAVAPYNNRSELLGFISDPSGNGFSGSYDGDFFIPASPEAGWGVRVNNVDYHNTRNYQDHIDMPRIAGSFSGFRTLTSTQEVIWSGQINNILDIKQTFSIYSKGLTAVIDVELTNITDTTMTDVYYMQTVDPDNNFQNSNNQDDLKTLNTILSQGDVSGAAVVSATQARRGGEGNSEIKLIGYAKNARVSYGGVTNRSPVDVYTGTEELKTSGSELADKSISLAFKFDEIAAGETVKFKLAFQLANSAIPQLTLDKDKSSHASVNNAYKTMFISGGEAQAIVDTDLDIITTQDHLKGAEIILATPHDGDLISLPTALPTGITKDIERSSGIKLVLIGEASVADYKTALGLIRYANTSTTPHLGERIINVLILDEIYTLSNAAQAKIGVVMPVTITGKIATDDVVNDKEKDQIKPTGTATAALDVRLVFTDKNGKKVPETQSEIAPSNSLGIWTRSTDAIDISSLADGDITLQASTLDDNGYTSTASKLFKKDTTIAEITILSPTMNQVVAANGKTEFSGTADPSSMVQIGIDAEHQCSTVTTEKGAWKCSIDKLLLNKTYPISAKSTDDAGNEKIVSSSFKTPELTVIIANPANDATVGNSSPLISGTSLPNATITVSAGEKRCTAITNSVGAWSCKLSDLSIGGPQKVTVTAKAFDGSEKADDINITVPDIFLLINSPQPDELLISSNIKVAGTSDPLAKIEVSTGVDGEICTTVADSNGAWSCNLEVTDLQENKRLTVSSEKEGMTKKTGSTNFRFEKQADKGTEKDQVTTALKGSGSSSPFILLFISFLTLLIRKLKSSHIRINLN